MKTIVGFEYDKSEQVINLQIKNENGTVTEETINISDDYGVIDFYYIVNQCEDSQLKERVTNIVKVEV